MSEIVCLHQEQLRDVEKVFRSLEDCPLPLMPAASVTHSQIGLAYLEHCAIVHTSTICRRRKLIPRSRMPNEHTSVTVNQPE
jgi:hypothetical protein